MIIQIVLGILLVSIIIGISSILISQKPPSPPKPKNCSDLGKSGIDQDCCT